ncbi:MAG TPA: HD domain-containing protein, partial [Thermoleophilia bacterium]
MKLPYDDVHLIADPLYGYLRITLSRAGEIAEADVIDNPWVQRLKRIHQLQSSWWVFPAAEHSRFAHSLGTMHLAGELARQVHPTLAEVEPGTPSLPLVEETLRLAGLLHDVGHGPFSHFCDEEYFQPVFGIDHEQISQYLISNELGGLIAALGRSPSGAFAAGEAVDPWHVAFLVRAEEGGAGAAGDAAGPIPRWVRLL